MYRQNPATGALGMAIPHASAEARRIAAGPVSNALRKDTGLRSATMRSTARYVRRENGHPHTEQLPFDVPYSETIWKGARMEQELQVNLNHCHAAHDLLDQRIQE